ncbi:putative nucleotidyltransferase, Ribonuclease H [Helianthus debilis subsp. tardiflorus]
MPFGLTNAPSTFQATMNDIFRGALRRYVLVFFDDILVYSASKLEHYHHLQMVLETLATNQLFAKASKCSFGVDSISYLGHVISSKGVNAEPDKLRAIQEWPQPTSLTSLRGFLGLTGYYRRFVCDYARLASPLTDLLKQQTFKWNDAATTAFKQLKAAMVSLISLTLPNFARPFDVTTDASSVAIGAVLSQNDRPIAFFSKKMCPRMQAASAYVRELYAITEAVKKWRQYLLGRKFNIFTDQRSLKHLLSQVVQTPEQYRWATKLLGYDFEIFYKPGKDNRVADALSRIDEPTVFAISSTSPKWVDMLKEFYKSAEGSSLVTKLINSGRFKLTEGLLFDSHNLFIPDYRPVRDLLLEEYHASTVGGHSGVKATVKRLSSSFTWPRLKDDVTNFVRNCGTCQQVKYPNHKPYGLLQPLPVPSNVWQDITMDFITNLPLSQGKSAVWVLVDRFSKFAHFIALPPKYGAVSLATLFLQHIYKLHGMPKSIVSDRDSIFLSQFWRELFKQVGTKLKFSTAYHPQSDGQTEVVNRCLQNYLRSFASDEPHLWSRFLYLAEYWYNTSHHSSINMSPFQALYGRPVPDSLQYVPGSSDMPSIDSSLKELDRLRKNLKVSLHKAQQRMVSLANAHRLDKTFSVGDKVYLRLKDYRQSTVAARSSKKLSKRFYGPFTVLERIGQVAYKLELPPQSRIHPVFHVSLLRQAHGNPTPATLPDIVDVDTNVPEAIIDQRIVGEERQVLVVWEGRSVEEATWESYDDFQVRFPVFQITPMPQLEDDLVVKGGVADTGQQSQQVNGLNSRPKRMSKRPARLMN